MNYLWFIIQIVYLLWIYCLLIIYGGIYESGMELQIVKGWSVSLGRERIVNSLRAIAGEKCNCVIINVAIRFDNEI